MSSETSFFNDARYQNSPLSALTDFLEQEERNEQARRIEDIRLVGYVLELGYDTARIITCDPYKGAVGGIPRGTLLILAADEMQGVPPHFTLLRVTGTAPTPLTGQVQETYFELHKKSMPELDRFTVSELQWGALSCSVLGMFYPDREDADKLAFSGDVNTVESAHRYRVFAPDSALLELIVNGLVDREGNAEPIGRFRATENELQAILGQTAIKEDPRVNVSLNDFRGKRTGMFGKTRLGKSNVLKVLVQAIIDAAATGEERVGQLIFDINGEYANDNQHDGSRSIRSANPDTAHVYALTQREATPSEPLRLNFYEQPAASLAVLNSLLDEAGEKSHYITALQAVDLPTIDEVRTAADKDRTRAVRRLQLFWAILHKAGCPANEKQMIQHLGAQDGTKPFGVPKSKSPFDPGYSQKLRDRIYKNGVPPKPTNLKEMRDEIERVVELHRSVMNSPARKSADSKPDPELETIFDADDLALTGFLVPKTGTGPGVMRPYFVYHSPDATNFTEEILALLDSGNTVILDLGSASDRIRTFFSDSLSRAVFAHQEHKFTSDTLGDHYMQLYFEEAHNLFPSSEKGLTGVYSRFAKEGAKFHIGMTYSTQSPSTVYGELLNQTENFFIGHLSSEAETSALARQQHAFAEHGQDIMRSRTPGYMRMLTQSNRFVIPVQVDLFEARRQD